MPVDNVNTAALRIVTEAAQDRVDLLTERLEGLEEDFSWCFPVEDLCVRSKEELELLKTSIFMMEQKLDQCTG